MFKYIILGFVQGFTEFIPVSSSGHLVIMQRLLGVQGEEVVFSIVLHLGTCLSLVVFFWQDILRVLRDKGLIVLILITTAITGTIGVLGKNFFERLFSAPVPVAVALLCTGVMLILTKGFTQGKRREIKKIDSVILGLTQGIAIIPGISRSGTTLSTLLFRRIERDTAFRFSFLVSIPVIIGAALVEAKDARFAIQLEPMHFIVGFIVSFFVGLISLQIVKQMLAKARLHYFGYYCIVVSVFTFLFVR